MSNAHFEFDNEKVIEIIGFFESYSGIGESARLCALSLRDSGFKVKCTSVEAVYRKTAAFSWPLDGFYHGNDKPSIRIFHLNPPMLPPAIFSLGFKAYKQSYNIGYWAWELEDIPAEWQAALKYMNAVMTPSEFTSRAIRKHTSKPVITVPHPVSYNLKGANEDIRARLNIPASTFLISSIFSFGSALERKNPQSLITCFKQAFNQNEDVMLVLKSNSGSGDEKTHINELIGDDQRIRLIDESWDRADILGLTQTSDLYASFHRSEGFGLTLAEALLLNTPVITTNWSGNMDFCNSQNAYLVESALVPVVTDNHEFKGCGNLSWAEVRHDAAIAQMRAAFKAIKAQGKPQTHALTIGYLKNNGYELAVAEIGKVTQV
ncbi:MAG: glycosyltransferase family 4 protein [Methylophilus sp.]|uniref:glycosyltransferase family 4 protein n=1 Tax=Methylophilus sp. TaxID=29541 RepID=UPI003F9FCE05